MVFEMESRKVMVTVRGSLSMLVSTMHVTTTE